MTLTQTLIKLFERNETNEIKLSNDVLIISFEEAFKDGFLDKELTPNELITGTLKCCESFYIDYLNNYITYERISEDYSVSLKDCEDFIKLGRLYNHNI